eukprot:scaffold208729_cov45-Tisochrysis_lutea.AAC.2
MARLDPLRAAARRSFRQAASVRFNSTVPLPGKRGGEREHDMQCCARHAQQRANRDMARG